ncbi:MAG: DNA repair protein RecN [Acholeplasmatales bacterium]|nr:DNA repair protein RecN [Acholeplasmatales bacterium]
MIRELNVKDFAIIEDLNINFNNGMTVLTGETGAGKSLIIDTISLLLGSRADSDMIRYGKSKAIVYGIFDYNNELDDLFESLSIPKNETIKIVREITESRNTIKVNDVNITLTSLKQISKKLADIHVQNDTYKLFNPDEYLTFLDPKNDKTFDKLTDSYIKALYEYNNAYSVVDKIKKNQKNATQKLDFLKYEKEEIEALDLYIGIDDELNEKVSRLSNFDKISNGLNSAYDVLNNEMSSIDSLYDAAKSLENISEYDKDFKDMASKLLDSYYISSEIKDNIAKAIRGLDFDQDELNLSIERLNDINKAKDKYKMSVEELLKHLEEITLEIDMALNYDEVLKEKENELKKSFEKLKASSIKLTEYRKKKSIELSKAIVKECVDLDLDSTKFEVKFNDVDYSDFYNKAIFNDNGVDIIDFYVSFNSGEPLHSLSKVASGGEASRMMLALKTYLLNDNSISLEVFDEIDTGVSGKTALKIANKMHNISKKIQVLCITHLPQVAAKGDNHIYIYKDIVDGRTKTNFKYLENEERVEEIAKMLSGDTISLYALEHAKELISNK